MSAHFLHDTCIRVLQDLAASRLCLERDWWGCEWALLTMMVGELRLAKWVEFKPRISPLRWTQPKPLMVLISPLAHAILNDARGAFHTKERFIQTRTTGAVCIRECPGLLAHTFMR